MRSPVVQNQALNLQVWFLTVLACYAVLELSLNAYSGERDRRFR
jgi:hypothetical protein